VSIRDFSWVRLADDLPPL